MFHHVVSFRLKPETDATARQLMVEEIRELPDRIPQISSLVCGLDHGLAEGNLDVAACVSSDGPAEYAEYAKHPVHVAVVGEFVRPHLAERVAVQFYGS